MFTIINAACDGKCKLFGLPKHHVKTDLFIGITLLIIAILSLQGVISVSGVVQGVLLTSACFSLFPFVCFLIKHVLETRAVKFTTWACSK